MSVLADNYSSSSLRSGVMVRQGMQQPAWLLIPLPAGLTPSKLCPWSQGQIPQEEEVVVYRYTEFCQSSALLLSCWWLPLIFPLPRGIYCISVGAEVWSCCDLPMAGWRPGIRGKRLQLSQFLLLSADFEWLRTICQGWKVTRQNI